MTTAAEQAFSALQTTASEFGAVVPDPVKSILTTLIDEMSVKINDLQQRAAADPALKQQVLDGIDAGKTQFKQLASEIASADNLSAEHKALAKNAMEKFDAFLDAERDETINGPQPATSNGQPQGGSEKP